MKRINLLITLLFASCLTAFAQTKMVTFQVSSPDSTPVYVFGNWNSWSNWPGTPMTALAGGKYTATLPIAINSTIEYLFVNGATPTKEVLNSTASCTNGNAVNTNRVLTIGNVDTAVCYTWATCNTCTITPPPPPPVPINVTFQVESPDSLPVSVQGSWNWSSFPGAGMTLVAPNKYAVTLQFPPNTNYEFLFVSATKTEALQPSMPCTNGNALYTNRTLNVGGADTTICYTWATCNTCPIAPPPVNANVTFQVEAADSTPVYVRGSWNGWTSNTLMTAIGGNKHQAVIPMTKSTNYEFKYQNGAGQTYETLNPAWTCTNGNGQYTNRVLALGTKDTTLCSVWSTCNACTVPQTNVLYTFQVSNPDSTPVFLLGSWNWNNYPGTPMTAIGGGKYQTTMSLPINDTTIEYLYVNGNAAKEALNPAWPCTNGNGLYTNRVIKNTGTTPKTLCNKWATCDTCGQVTPVNINVKFAVQAPDSMPVYVFGNWNNWSNFPGAPMTFNTGSNTYEATIPLLSGTAVEYFYVNGIGTKEAIVSTMPCTNGNAQYTNRLVTLGNKDTTICNKWKTCVACGPVSIYNINKEEIAINMNTNFIQINTNSLTKIDQIEIFDIMGKKVFASTAKLNSNSKIAVSLNTNTIYVVKVYSGGNVYKLKSMITN